MIVAEASMADGAALVELFRRTPLDAGTAFVLDRSPDFWALLALRGHYRTFVARDGDGVVGTATALWHDALDGARRVRVGEVVDLRVAPRVRGTRVTAGLLAAVRQAFHDARVSWALCLIGDRNASARMLVTGRAGFPCLAPLTRWASVHYVAWRVPERLPPGVSVRPADPSDGAALRALVAPTAASRRFVPEPTIEWPDRAGRGRAWLATEGATPIAALVAWSGEGVRALRVVRHRWQDTPLRTLVAAGAAAGLAPPLPAPGGVLRMWATRWLTGPRERRDVARALIRHALRSAATEGVHVLQVNVPEHDPIRRALPALPRSTYWSTLYGCCLRSPEIASPPPMTTACHHADVALV